MGFATFPICSAAVNDKHHHLPRNANHTPRRIPLISSRTASLRPLPSCCYFVLHKLPDHRSVLTTIKLHISRYIWNPDVLFPDPRASSRHVRGDREPKVSLSPMSTALFCGHRSLGDTAGTRRCLPLPHSRAGIHHVAPGGLTRPSTRHRSIEQPLLLGGYEAVIRQVLRHMHPN